MRPQSMQWFDGLYLGANALGVVTSLALMRRAQDMVDGLGMGFTGGMALAQTETAIHIVITAAINLSLWYFISRRASNIALWLLVALVGVGLYGLLFGSMMPTTLFADWAPALVLMNVVLQTCAVACLFMPDARAWFAEKAARRG